MSEPDAVLVERDGPVTIVSINRPHCRNAVDGATARKLYDAFLAFDADNDASIAVFTGTGGYFCAGADLKAVAAGAPNKKREVGGHDSIAPMGPSGFGGTPASSSRCCAARRACTQINAALRRFSWAQH